MSKLKLPFIVFNLVLIYVFWSEVALADVWKCGSKDGKTVYSSDPCDKIYTKKGLVALSISVVEAPHSTEVKPKMGKAGQNLEAGAIQSQTDEKAVGLSDTGNGVVVDRQPRPHKPKAAL